MLTQFWNDEAGVIISAELVFILTILVIGLVVGLSELQYGVVSELDDVSNAIGKLNQSYFFTGFSARKFGNGVGGGGGFGLKSATTGSIYSDTLDACDNGCSGFSTVGCDAPTLECAGGVGAGGAGVRAGAGGRVIGR